MEHSPWGFQGYDQLFFDCAYRLKTVKGVLRTSSYNLKANHHYTTYERLTKNSINKFERLLSGVVVLVTFQVHH